MKEDSDNASVHPRTRAGLFSVLFFTYTLGTFRKGRSWNANNLYQPLDCHRSEVLGDKLESLWIHHVEECKISERKPNICIVLLRLFWMDILMDSSLLILSLVPRIIQPLLLGNILSYFSSSTAITRSEAYWYISLLVIFNLMSTIVSVQYKFSSSMTAMKIRIACSTCIHKKILRMKLSSQNNALNLISNDLSRFDRTANYVYYVWGSPLFLISILNLLYYDVGVSGLAGATWFIIYMFLQSYFAKWIGSYRNIIAKKTDVRIKLMNEILSSIKVIKMYGWEEPFCRLVTTAREVEMKIVKKVSYFKGILYSLQAFVNVTAIFLALLSMVILKEEITAPKVFKLIMYYYSFNFAITLMFPLSVTKATELHQVLQRVNEFLLREEIAKPPIKNGGQSENRVVLQDFATMWHTNQSLSKGAESLQTDEDTLLRKQELNCILRNINIKIEDSMLYGITGGVGSGRTTLLLSILGETSISGHIHINGSISYASQEPWFIPGTIRQNILFGQPLEQGRYSEVIRVCGLKTDLDLLPEYDRTIVGECGLCLSGGQKSRINLARAIYRKADIYIFDDPLSSVDVNVANNVMEQCILEFLRNKCRLLVTHNLNHLKKCDHILIIKSGRLEKYSTFEQLEKEGCILQDYSKPYVSTNETVKELNGVLYSKKSENPGKKSEPLSRRKSEESDLFAYLTSGNGTFVIALVFFIFIITQAAESSIFLFISYWTHCEEIKDSRLNVTLAQPVLVVSGRYLYLFIFVAILGTLLVCSVFRAVFYTMMVMKSSRTLHNRMLHKVIYGKMSFFEMVDIGQILSRFSKDLGAVDEVLPRTILESCIVVLGIVARILLIGYVNPYLIIVVLAFTAIFSHSIKVFVYTSKNMKRIEGNLMGPLLTQVRSSIEGLSTIRAVDAQDVMESEYSKHQNRYTSSCYMFCTITHAFSFAVEFITTIFISIVTVSCFFMEERIRLNGSQIGLAITQAMAFTTYLQFCIVQCVQANNHLVAVERIKEYEDLPQESTSIVSDGIDEEWPTLGNISFKGVQVQYNGDSQPALKDLTFTIQSGEKIGIVGRTGGGKTSLIASILKLANVEGKILIDSYDIQDIPACIIRSRISVIPQDPVLFTGTLRYNLDPFEQMDDHLLYQALKEVGWSSSSSEINDLNDQIIGLGSNLSIGQKQLICLARSIIRRNKIILIDEATSNMDAETDLMIQQVIRKQFKDCTVLTIAHRISTVLDYDKIMVIDSGRLIEFAKPDILLKDNTSRLYEMIYEKNK
ncbi:probable multidrug resistance-associated protein lethal(2)03659 [Coccinella septempunctata]|uniref:probable multidrug resistance-associated protein lethal(2)03659 n=1 Tax=Coccinella septempunctata TaxID=41139 RepID=UPI001D07768E|nr:probable multidrug resistance-associated protein lethal(2)03659 [Coccinella septempunctata]